MKAKLNSILLIDDDEGTNFINKRVIQKADIAEEVVTTYNGSEALDYLCNQGKYENPGKPFPQPMLILLDINMPIMDGWEFLDAYHKLHESKKSKIIIVMLTTSFNPDDSKRAGEYTDISGFKNKPLSIETLNDIIQTHFPELLD